MKATRNAVMARLSAEEYVKLQALAHAFNLPEKETLNVCVQATYDMYHSSLTQAAMEKLKQEQEAVYVGPETEGTDRTNP